MKQQIEKTVDKLIESLPKHKIEQCNFCGEIHNVGTVEGWKTCPRIPQVKVYFVDLRNVDNSKMAKF